MDELENERRLFVALIPAGLTSVLQLGDLVGNGPCKKFLRKKYLSWQFSKIARLRKERKLGHLVVKITRENLDLGGNVRG